MDLMANNFSDGLKAPPVDDEVLKIFGGHEIQSGRLEAVGVFASSGL